MVRREKSNYIIQAVAHALDVLEQFHGDGELGVTELSKRLKLHKNNVFRIVSIQFSLIVPLNFSKRFSNPNLCQKCNNLPLIP